MGRRILNFGLEATHARISKLTSIEDPVCASDYEAFIYDPRILQGAQVGNLAFFRKQAELGDLVLRKGGLALCVLRPPSTLVVSGGPGYMDVLSLLEAVDAHVLGMVKNALKMGITTKWGIIPGANGVTVSFLRAVLPNLRSEAFLQADETGLRAYNGAVDAANSAGWPVSFEFVCGPGRLCFVPVAVDIPEGQLGAAVAHMVEEHFGGPIEIETPAWVNGVSVPGADANDTRIAELEKQAEGIAAELLRLNEERSDLLSLRVLVFGYGKSVLEPAVRRAFRELGFKVLEPEDYEGEWDVDLADQETGQSAIGEVEGSEGAINVDKFRQLLDYVEAEENAGRQRKGVLIGNGYRLKELGAPERKGQFTEKAVKRARGFEYCLLPTSELFKAVCAVLRHPADEALKKRIRQSILSTVEVWKFREDVGASESAAAASK